MHYPNKKNIVLDNPLNHDKRYTAGRGMNLEEAISESNQYYLDHDLAIIYKKPTPIQIVKVEYPVRTAAKITEAYYRKPSTTDYNGLYKGCYIDFEAKETKFKNRFPFANIADHQVEHLKHIKDHGGIAFLIIAFTSLDEVYLLDASYMINHYYQKSPRHLSYDFIKKMGHLIKQSYAPRLDYLKIVDEFYLRRSSHES